MNEELLLNEEVAIEETKNFDLKSAGIGAGLGIAGTALAAFAFKKAKTYIKDRKIKKMEPVVDVDVDINDIDDDLGDIE